MMARFVGFAALGSRILRILKHYVPFGRREGHVTPYPMDDPDKLIADITIIIRHRPVVAKWHVARGNAYGGKGDCDKAIADFTRGIELEPQSASGYMLRSLACEYKGDTVNAGLDRERVTTLRQEK